MKIAIIPARGGSTRIPRKNLRLFHGKPIIDYSIENAQLCEGLFDKVIVSSDDEDIMLHASRVGAEVHMRPLALAEDQVGTQAVGRHVALWAETVFHEEVTHACVIYATAPLLARTDLWRGWEHVRKNQHAFAFGVGTEPLQDAGQFYWANAKHLIAGTPLVSPASAMIPIDAERVCDINVEADWQRALQMYRALHPERETLYGGQAGGSMAS